MIMAVPPLFGFCFSSLFQRSRQRRRQLHAATGSFVTLDERGSLTSLICAVHAQGRHALRNVARPALHRVEADHADRTAVLAAPYAGSSRASRHEAKDQNQKNEEKEARHQKCANLVHVPSLPYLR